MSAAGLLGPYLVPSCLTEYPSAAGLHLARLLPPRLSKGGAPGQEVRMIEVVFGFVAYAI